MTTDRRRLLQRLAFSESRHFSLDMFPANTMAYDRYVVSSRKIIHCYTMLPQLICHCLSRGRIRVGIGVAARGRAAVAAATTTVQLLMLSYALQLLFWWVPIFYWLNTVWHYESIHSWRSLVLLLITQAGVVVPKRIPYWQSVVLGSVQVVASISHNGQCSRVISTMDCWS